MFCQFWGELPLKQWFEATAKCGLLHWLNGLRTGLVTVLLGILCSSLSCRLPKPSSMMSASNHVRDVNILPSASLSGGRASVVRKTVPTGFAPGVCVLTTGPESVRAGRPNVMARKKWCREVLRADAASEGCESYCLCCGLGKSLYVSAYRWSFFFIVLVLCVFKLWIWDVLGEITGNHACLNRFLSVSVMYRMYFLPSNMVLCIVKLCVHLYCFNKACF